MRFLILSDLHANLEALQAVIAEAEGEYDRIVVCGDFVGYGADPNAVTDWARANANSILRGNHDKACVGLQDLEWFNPAARASAEWTASALTEINRKWLRELPQGPVAVTGASFQALHGSPADEDEYITTRYEAANITETLEVPVSFFGHTHVQGGFKWIRFTVSDIPSPAHAERELVMQLEPDPFYLINPGSTGQPRDNDPRAAYALYMPEDRLLVLRRTPYDVKKAQSKILAAGLPEVLAIRLSLGL